MSLLVIKMLTVLVSTISNSQVILQKLITFFSKYISVYAIFNDQSFNGTLNYHVSFEQLGPGHLSYKLEKFVLNSEDPIWMLWKPRLMIWCFTSLSTLFKSYEDEGVVIMKVSVQ